MYVPEHYKMPDVAAAALMQANPFATLVSHDSDGLFATHMPTVTKRAGDVVTVECHLARPNPHWKRLADTPGGDALMIFSGPDAYMRPGWYPSKGDGGKVVPTWNYAAVHAYGRIEVIQDGDWLLNHVTELTRQQESPYETPWTPGDAPDAYIAALIRGIVGIKFSVTRLDAKAKLGQNRPARDVLGAADGLEARGERDDRVVSTMMRAAIAAQAAKP